jgi:hypothetical protein
LTCGRNLKGCTETFGGRKALKTKIRELQSNGKVNDVVNEMRLDQLFTLYGEVSTVSCEMGLLLIR